MDRPHGPVVSDRPGLCPTCLERAIVGHGEKRWLVEEVKENAPTGRWVCPLGTASYQPGAFMRLLWK